MPEEKPSAPEKTTKKLPLLTKLAKRKKEGKKMPWAKRGKGGWFHKIPRDVLLSPGGVFLIFLAFLMEAIDFMIPWPLVEEIIMLPLNIFFCISLSLIAKVPLRSMVIPFIIERIPLLSTVLPTFLLFLLRMFF